MLTLISFLAILTATATASSTTTIKTAPVDTAHCDIYEHLLGICRTSNDFLYEN